MTYDQGLARVQLTLHQRNAFRKTIFLHLRFSYIIASKVLEIHAVDAFLYWIRHR